MGPKRSIPWPELFAAAKRVRENAYAPYSKFKVGAAVLAEDGRLFVGANVENASYGLAICAERAAVSRAIADGAQRILAVAIVADTPTPCPPCGMCRQTLAEFGEPDLPIKAQTLEGKETSHSLRELLPEAFDKRFL